jgi:hypothetical protein
MAEVRGVAAMIANTAAADDPIEINHLIARGAIAKRAIPRAEQDLAEARQELTRIAGEVTPLRSERWYLTPRFWWPNTTGRSRRCTSLTSGSWVREPHYLAMPGPHQAAIDALVGDPNAAIDLLGVGE